MDSSKTPLLSVVVAIVSDTTDWRCDISHLAGCLEALSRQVSPPPLEIIVPYHQNVENIDAVKRRYSDVIFIYADNLKTLTSQGSSREHHDELRARGLQAARGDIVALIEDHGRPDSRWCARLVKAHRQNFAAIGGAIENGIDRPLNWAVYFSDFGKYQNPVPAGESPFASDANISYKRSALEAVRPVWQESFHEPTVNWALIEHGHKLGLSPKVIVYQHRTNLALGQALKERFIWGRSYAATRTRLISAAQRIIYAALSPALPAILLPRMTLNVARKGRCISAFLKAFPLTTLLSFSWAGGELVGYLTGRANSAQRSVTGSATASVHNN